MIRKGKLHNPQEYILSGMIFFLIGITAAMIADGRMIGAIFTNIIHQGSLLNTVQGFADGLSLPMFGASIFFNIRGLVLSRSR